MLDTTSLTTLIASFKQITEPSSISPSTVGSLLENIVALLDQLAADQDVADTVAWKKSIATLSGILTWLEQGEEDENQVHLALTTANATTGETSTNQTAAHILPATTTRAGVMTAKQAQQLASLVESAATKSDIENAIATMKEALAEYVTTDTFNEREQAQDTLISNKANKIEVYTKTESDTAHAALQASIDSKADASKVYTKSEVASLINQAAESIDANIYWE